MVTDGVYDALIQWLKKRHDWKVERKSIALLPGVVPTIFTAINAFTQPNEGVIIQTPVTRRFWIGARTGPAADFKIRCDWKDRVIRSISIIWKNAPPIMRNCLFYVRRIIPLGAYGRVTIYGGSWRFAGSMA